MIDRDGIYKLKGYKNELYRAECARDGIKRGMGKRDGVVSSGSRNIKFVSTCWFIKKIMNYY